MESVARAVARDRRPGPEPFGSAQRYVNLWVEPEALGAERVSAFVLILRTRGCYWADLKGCSMCGYAKDTVGRSATSEELAGQLDRAMKRYRAEPYVKIYTSGSFLDDREVDPASRERIVSAFSGSAHRLLFETLPEFVTAETLAPLRDRFSGELEVAMGLESSQPEVLQRFVNKGSTPQEYFAAAERIRSVGLRAKGYLLLKPPYLAEREAITDVLASIAASARFFDTLSINPVHIQGGTVVEWLYQRRRYRPPWLWSLTEVLGRGAEIAGSTRLVSFPTAGGLARGPHNCPACDRKVLEAIAESSLSQRFEPLASLDCACRSTWSTTLELESLGLEA